MKAFFQAYWLYAAGMVLFLLLSYGEYACRRHQHNKAVQEETEAATLISQAKTAAEKRHTAYLLDSTQLATQRQALQRQDATLAQQDHAISDAYPTPIYLPAHPPRERASAPAARRATR